MIQPSNIELALQEFPEIFRHTINDVRHYVTPEGDLPSVTSILSATSDKSGIKAWRESIGAARADAIVKKSTDIGSLMHESLEQYLLGNGMLPGSNTIRVQARTMAELMVSAHLDGKLTKILGLEANLYYGGLWSGCTDCVGIYEGQLSIVDFKNARKPKKPEFVHDYKIQVCAYALAYEYMFGVPINQGVILIITQDYQTQRFLLDKETMDEFKALWVERVEQYYSKV